MKEEFNLSDKEFTSRVFVGGKEDFSFQAIPSRDVKEFIRLLKEELDNYRKDNRLWLQPEAQTLDEFLDIIDRLAGDKLI